MHPRGARGHINFDSMGLKIGSYAVLDMAMKTHQWVAASFVSPP